jgi:hypothetical protein
MPKGCKTKVKVIFFLQKRKRRGHYVKTKGPPKRTEEGERSRL